MTKQLILVSHGHFCEECNEMIMGPLEFVFIQFPLLPEEGIDDLRLNL